MTIAGEQAIQALDCIEALGIPADDIAGRLGLGRTGLAAPGTRLSRILFDSLFLTAAEMAGDPLLGLHAGMAKAPADLLFFVSLSQACIGEALAEWTRLSRVVSDSLAARLVERDAAAWLRVVDTAPTSDEGSRHVLEYLAGQFTQYLSLATAGACHPTSIRFPHAPGGPVAEYETVLGAPVSFRHEAFELHLRAADLRAPIVTANPDILRITRQAAEQQLRQAESGSFRALVETALRRCIREAGDDSREGVAALLATSVRTLQRRLGDEQCSFRDLRDAVRRDVAEDLLANSARSVGEIAELLAFADVAAFGKAFRRWTGASPRQFRSRARGAD